MAGYTIIIMKWAINYIGKEKKQMWVGEKGGGCANFYTVRQLVTPWMGNKLHS